MAVAVVVALNEQTLIPHFLLEAQAAQAAVAMAVAQTPSRVSPEQKILEVAAEVVEQSIWEKRSQTEAAEQAALASSSFATN